MFFVVVILAHLVAALGYLAVAWQEVEVGISLGILTLALLALARHWGKGPENVSHRRAM